MIYILMIWTMVGYNNSTVQPKYDWRALGEFQAELRNSGFQTSKTAQQMCEDAAKQLGLAAENYRCVRSK